MNDYGITIGSENKNNYYDNGVINVISFQISTIRYPFGTHYNIITIPIIKTMCFGCRKNYEAKKFLFYDTRKKMNVFYFLRIFNNFIIM